MGSLDQLAARCGIQQSSVDVFGEERQITPELKLALLNAMRFDVADDLQAKVVLDQLEAREWKRPLPPVIVAYSQDAAAPETSGLAVPITLPTANATGTIHWSVDLESGGTRSGQARFNDLELLQSFGSEGKAFERRRLTLDPDLPWGYHRLRLNEHPSSTVLIVTPGKCWLPAQPDDRRLWGIAANLYLLRSENNWGIGDFSDLRALLSLLNHSGADALGLNPLHAMFPDRPEDASPYSPSDRLLLNVLNIDVETIPEFAVCEKAEQLLATSDFRAKLGASRDADLVNYKAVADLKLAILPLLFDEFEQCKDPDRLSAFEAFHQERPELLDRACLFQALRAHFCAQDPNHTDCSTWPDEYRNTASPAVAAFAAEHPKEVRYQLWLQWIADTQLKSAADAARGMAVGLYRDLAVGAHPTGAEVWTHPDILVAGAHVGAPPDILNRSGQNWGLPPLHPIAAREQAYSGFIELLRANMRYAGGLRIDHAMALLRLYWIPKENDAADGAYVHYPIEDLIGILALESQRNHCLVVGEALGTVPEGFRERLAQANILAYSVLFFEIQEDEFVPPQKYPYLGLSVASNHDLATVQGWWESSDLALREDLGLFPQGSSEAREERADNRESLVRALRAEGLVGANINSSNELDVDQYLEAVHRFLARTNSLLAMIQLEDVTGERHQVNVPGTSDEHANWRRRFPVALEDLASDPRLIRMMELMKQERKAAGRLSSAGAQPAPVS